MSERRRIIRPHFDFEDFGNAGYEEEKSSQTNQSQEVGRNVVRPSLAYNVVEDEGIENFVF